MTNLLNSLGEPQDTVSGSAVLVVRRGPNAGSQFRLDQPVTSAGRHPANNIVVDDITVSRRHAEFLYERGEFRVFDVGSLNGTYVNGEPIHLAVLTNGDEIRLGKFRLVFWWNWRQVDAVGVGHSVFACVNSRRRPSALCATTGGPHRFGPQCHDRCFQRTRDA
jgi:pSer/pThr/pTyr-binding forkhead associated (FHA) protein